MYLITLLTNVSIETSNVDPGQTYLVYTVFNRGFLNISADNKTDDNFSNWLF